MTKPVFLKIASRSLIATLLVLLIYILLNHYLDASPWKGMKISRSALTVEYCEWNNPSAFFHQRMNTYSNLAYFFLGMMVVLISLHDRKESISKKNLLLQFPLLSFFFGCCLLYLCLGSSFFHASLTWPGQRMDMNGTYSVAIGLSGISAYRLKGKNISERSKRSLLLILLLTILLFVELHLRISSFVLLPALIILIVIITTTNYIKNKGSFKSMYALMSLLFLVAAGILRVADVSKIGCDPLSFYQGHSLWHLFTGLSAFFLYWFYRSEEVN